MVYVRSQTWRHSATVKKYLKQSNRAAYKIKRNVKNLYLICITKSLETEERDIRTMREYIIIPVFKLKSKRKILTIVEINVFETRVQTLQNFVFVIHLSSKNCH